MPRPKQRTPELRDHVLAVALQRLAREGVSGLTARELAHEAETSTPAVYELFGDKAGLVREIFFAGFRLLAGRLGELRESDDPRASLSYKLRKLAQFKGARVLCTDPYILDETFEPLDKVLRESEVIVVGAPHRAYRGLELGDREVVDIWGITGPIRL